MIQRLWGNRFFMLFCIIFAGEIIFSLPFHVARFFRPTFMEVFNLNNAELGDIFALYGVMAMLAYLPGGIIVDAFSSRKLMSFSLLATALGGVVLLGIPNKTVLALVFAYWGVTTIFMFWAAMLKATRAWGGVLSQGKAFGIVDGGRGLVAASVATLIVIALGFVLPSNVENLSPGEQRRAIQLISMLYTFLTVAAAVLILVVLPEEDPQIRLAQQTSTRFSAINQLAVKPIVWCQACIVLTAYCAYKGLDYYTLYATEVLGKNEIESAQLMANASFLRPVAALVAGILADKIRTSITLMWTFFTLLLSYLVFALLSPTMGQVWIIEANIVLSFFLVFALRGIYFALLEESKVSMHLTGASVGIISFVGFTPDIFFASLVGRVLDASPGVAGFNTVFLILGGLTLIGMVATGLFLSLASPADGDTVKQKFSHRD